MTTDTVPPVMIGVFVRRLIGAASLDPATYEEVEADRGATIQAIAVVVPSTRRAVAVCAIGWLLALLIVAMFTAVVAFATA